MAFEFYIDGQLTDQPVNSTELTTSIRRNSDLGGFLVTQDVSITYAANNAPPSGTISGYAYIKNLFDQGTCNEVSVEVLDRTGPTETYRAYTGTIKIPAVTIDEQAVELTTKIDDNSFYSYIKNNRNIPFNLYATKTKNGSPITAPQVYDVDMFVSSTGVYHSTVGNYFKGYRVYDVLAFLIPAISDNKVMFESYYLQNLPGAPDTPDDPIELFIFDGFALANANQAPALTVTLEKILSELFKLKDVSFYIDMTDPDAPVFRLENSDWFYDGATILTFNEPLDVKTSINADKIFGTVNVGSDYNPGGPATVYTWPSETSYYGWKKETYTPLGQCNLDTELDLNNEFYIASNAINDQVNGATTENLDAVFIVECDNVDTDLFTAIAVDYDTFATGTIKYYNIGLNNVNKVQIHGNNFQTALTNTQDSVLDIFKASMGTETTLADFNPSGTGNPYTLVPIPFPERLYLILEHWDNPGNLLTPDQCPH